LLIARTDACSVKGLEEALKRGRFYAEAGADIVFVESPASIDELRVISRKLSSIQLLVNMVEGGKTPIVPFKDLRAMGFKIVLYPTSSVRVVAKALQG
jgi:2-methylisocitrate lyase-like PEP mutase family enzyme